MSNRITLNRIKPHTLNICAFLGDFWYSLRDRSGHIRDWAPAQNAKLAREWFAWNRPNGILKGYTVHRGDRVEEGNAA